MPSILLIEKTGYIKEISVKEINEDEIYKKAGFKSKDGFICQTNWKQNVNNKSYIISLYGKTKGRAGTENKYDFPPPVDKELYFGACILLNRNEDTTIVDITKSEWLKIYEKLFGGFQDIGSEDSEEEEEEEEDDLPVTKEGYVKDDFIVDEEEEDEEEEEEEEDDETELLDNDEDDEDTSEEEIEDDLDDEPEEDDDDEEEEEEEEDDEETQQGDGEEDNIVSKKKTSLKKKQEIKKKIPIIEKIVKKTTKPTSKSTKGTKRGQETITRTESNNYLNCSNELMEEEYI
jgi:hypothetical protein